jgi:hypothetical protein
MAIPRLAWATLTIPPASQLNGAASSADARQISAAGSRSIVPLTYGTDRIGGLLLNVLPKAGDATKLLVQVLWGFAGSAVASVQLNGLDLPGTATVTTYLGTQTAADSALVAAFAAQSITYVDTLQGFAYSVIEIAQGAIGSELQFTSLFTGALLYDPRLDSTVSGGSGSNRLDTPSTWSGAVDCPALALANFLASTVYGASETVDWVGVIAAADANESTVGSPAEKRRTIGVTFITPSSVADVAEALRAYAGCFLIPSAGGIKLLPDADGSAVAAYSHTAGTIASITALQMRDLGNSPTSVEIVYTDTTVVPWRDASAFADLPGAGTTLPYRLSQVRMPGVKRYSQARREAIERLNKLTLQDLSTQIEVFDVGIQHQIGDIVAVSHPIGLTNKLFRVTLPESTQAGRWVLPLIEHDPDCYSTVVETVPTYANSGALISDISSSVAVLTLTCTAQTFTYDTAGAASPSTQTITFTANLAGSLTGTATFSGTLLNAAGTSLGTVTLGGSGNTRTLTNAQFESLGAAQTAVVVATLAGYTDQATVVKLRDGAAGPGTYSLTITVYQAAVGQPAAPSGGSYIFTGDVFVAPSGWSRSMPTASTVPVWASECLFVTTTPTVAVPGPA